MTLSVVVPYRPTDAYRRQAWEWCQQRIRAFLPDAEIVVGTVDHGPFHKTAAVNDAVARSTGQILLILDADIAVPRSWLSPAYQWAKAGGWALTEQVHYLTLRDTRMLLASATDVDLAPPAHTEFSGGTSWGGAVMLPRDAFEAVGGMDERFQSWGPEDIAFGLALDACWAKHRRLPGEIHHLWHPPGPREWHEDSHELFARYLAAVGDREAMQSVVPVIADADRVSS